MAASRDSSLDVLFQPVNIAGLHLRNRAVMAPMTRGRAPGGVPIPEVIDYYRRRAENDVGLIISEGIGVDHPPALGAGTMNEGDLPLLHGAAALARWREIVTAVHDAGGLIFPQLWHQGVMRRDGTGHHPDARSVRPSGSWGPMGRSTSAPPDYLEQMRAETRPMTATEIGDAIAAFARSAANAKQVGFDGIAIHGAHGYLIDTFFWHETNRREDRWGGDIGGRARFGADVVRAVRDAVGPGMPIMFRYSQWKQQDYDARIAETPEELELYLGPLVDAGVDIFDASTRVFSTPAFAGSALTLAGWTQKITGRPTSAVGGIGLNKELRSMFTELVESTDNLDEVARRIESGEFDLFSVGRSLACDPFWVKRAQAGEPFAPFDVTALAELR